MTLDRSEWPVYERVPIEDPAVVTQLERLNMPTTIGLRECPVCGAREREIGKRIISDPCDPVKHHPPVEVQVPTPRRAGQGDESLEDEPAPATRKQLARVRTLFDELP